MPDKLKKALKIASAYSQKPMSRIIRDGIRHELKLIKDQAFLEKEGLL